ncbi:MAG: hypothetical protein AB1610_06180 [Nitrospirota bacterium]
MKKPVIRYLVASPFGDIPVANNRLDLPLEVDPLKTSYRVYFKSIADFLMRENYVHLLQAIKEKLDADTNIQELKEIIIRTEKHGALYHPASINVVFGNNTLKFGLNVAVTERGKDSLKKEFTLLKMLHDKFNLPYLPKPYYADEVNSMVFLLEEWFEGYHEFHLASTENGGHKVKFWEYGKGDRFLSDAQAYEIYRQASLILTLYYDIENFKLIYPWHHAAGDFVAKIINENNPPSPLFVKGGDSKSPTLKKGDLGGFLDKKIDVRLTTVRGYEPFLNVEEDIVHPTLALFYFLLHLSIQMRLDRLDGVGDVVWADETCIDATLSGFVQSLEHKKDFRDSIGSATSFLNLLISFSIDDLKNTFRPIAAQFEHTKDFPIIEKNLEDHVSRFYLTLQNYP